MSKLSRGHIQIMGVAALILTVGMLAQPVGVLAGRLTGR